MGDFVRRLSSLRSFSPSASTSASASGSNQQEETPSPEGEVEQQVSADPRSRIYRSPGSPFDRLPVREIRRLAMDAVVTNQPQVLLDALNTKVFPVDDFFGGKVKRTLLHCAASFGAKDCVDILIRNGAKINGLDSVGNAPLHMCAQSGHKECIRFLLERGADIKMQNRDGWTALHWLAANGHDEIMKFFIEKTNCEINSVDFHGRIPLHLACQNGHSDSVLILIKYNTDINKLDAKYRSPLIYACLYGQYDSVKILLDHNAVVELEQDGDGPLELSIKGNSKKCCFLLLSRFPSLIPRFVQYSSRPEVDEQKLLSIFDYVCSDLWRADFQPQGNQRFSLSSITSIGSTAQQEPKSVRAPIIRHLEEVAAINGQELFSLSADLHTGSKVFIRQVNILSKLNPSDWANRSPTNESSEPVTNKSEAQSSDNTASSSSSEKSNQRNARIPPFESLWMTLQEWLHFLASSSTSASAILSDLGSLPATRSFFESRSRPLHGSSTDSFMKVSTSKQTEGENVTESSRDDEDYERVILPNEVQTYLSNDDAGDKENGEEIPVDTSLNQERANKPCKEAAPSASFEDLIPDYFDRIGAVIHGFYLYCCAVEMAKKTYQNVSSPSSSSSSTRKLMETKSVQKALPTRFKEFVHDNLNILRQFVKHRPKILFQHFHFLLDHYSLMNLFIDMVRSHPFDVRKEWFYENLDSLVRERSDGNQPDPFREQDAFQVDRQNPFEASCDVLARALQDQMEARVLSNFAIRFEGEAGIGAGVRREWFNVMSREIINPDYGLFVPSSDGGTVQPNTNSHINPDHLSYFRFAGWVVGLALVHRELLDVYFTRSFYKHILGSPISLEDLTSIDPEYHKSLKWLLDNNIDECGLELTFSVEIDSFGEMQHVELIPNGSNVTVNEENKHEYVQMAAEFKMTSAIGLQICAFLDGFERFVPHSLVCMFDEYELELLISGLPSIDIGDWKANTNYSGLEPTDEIVTWLWDIIQLMSPQERVLLLQFATGSSRVPLGGFGALMGASGPTKFTLSLMPGDENRLPTASTCFNLFKVPRYRTMREFHEKLIVALRCGSKGFEFA